MSVFLYVRASLLTVVLLTFFPFGFPRHATVFLKLFFKKKRNYAAISLIPCTHNSANESNVSTSFRVFEHEELDPLTLSLWSSHEIRSHAKPSMLHEVV